MNNIVGRILKESKKSKKIIGVRKYNEGDDFWCGYIVDYNDEIVLIQHYTKFGKPDGIVVEKITDIESIDTDDDYSKSYQYLIKNAHKIEKQTTTIFQLGRSDNWPDLLKQLHAKDELVSIEINDDILVSGLLAEMDNEFINLKGIGKLGEDMGNTLYRISDITSIHYDSMEERKRKLLYDWRYKTRR